MSNFAWTINRAGWEEPGWTVAEHTSSPPLDWDQIRNVCIHYPGDPSIPESPSRANFISYIQNTQRYYVTSRGYSIGYNAKVWDGMSAEIRGDTFRCAANGNTAVNQDSFAVQVRAEGLNADADPASAAEIEVVRDIIAWCERQAGRTLDIIGHRDVRSTGCPGDAIYNQIQAGVFRPVVKEPAMALKLFKLDDTPPLYASADGITAIWVSARQWKKWRGLDIGADPDQIELLDKAEAVRFTLVGPCHPDHTGLWANSGRL